MNSIENITFETMWEAVISSNNRFDEIFYYAVKTTGIYCKPSCKSKIPLQQNVLFFYTKNDALEKGYRPCKRCRPDLHNQSIGDFNDEIVNSVCSILENDFFKQNPLNSIANRVGISPFHLHRIFLKKTGITPKVFQDKIRVKKAKALLVNSTFNNVEICYAVGFQSVSQFYNIFRKYNKCSPKEFKQKNTIE